MSRKLLSSLKIYMFFVCLFFNSVSNLTVQIRAEREQRPGDVCCSGSGEEAVQRE